MDVLVVPPAATRDAKSVEMLRVWIAEKALHCSLRTGMYADQGVSREAFAWGMILADAVQHISDALAAQGLGDREDILNSIINAFQEELSAPTSDRNGGFVANPA